MYIQADYLIPFEPLSVSLQLSALQNEFNKLYEQLTIRSEDEQRARAKIIWIPSFSRIISILLCNVRSYDGVHRMVVSHMLMIGWSNQEF